MLWPGAWSSTQAPELGVKGMVEDGAAYGLLSIGQGRPTARANSAHASEGRKLTCALGRSYLYPLLWSR